MAILKLVPRNFRPVILGMLGGAINGALCYFKIPVAAQEYENFQWHIILAGAVHGALLALILDLFVTFFQSRNLGLRLMGLPLSGYFAGWFSFISVWFSLESKWRLDSLVWPFAALLGTAKPLEALSPEMVIGPFVYFGLVVSVYYFFLVLLRWSERPDFAFHLIAGIASGILGSLWFWISFKPFYLSFLHGAIWGACVGWGMYLKTKSFQND